MAKNEIVNVLTIKTEQSQQTIKGLKKEISDLKKTLDNATIGSEQFEQASKELAQAQKSLKTAMSGQKQEVTALAGSYDALVAEMAELKKEWRATADEAKRNSLGAEIEKINTQLKGLDSTIGNNQRLVGSYAEEFKKALAEQDDATLKTRTQLESVQKVTSGLASGYAAVQGVMTLLNIENENLQQAMVKVQSAMAIAQGVGGLKDLVEGLSRAKVAFQGAAMGAQVMSVEATTASTAMVGTATATKSASVAMNGFKKALIATGIGALVVLLGTVISKIVDYVEKTKAAKEEQNKYNKELEEQIKKENEKRDIISDAVGTTISKYRMLQSEWRNLKTQQEKTDWITDNADAFSDLGLAITDVASAQEVLIKQADKVINALTLQAEAAALQDIYQENYKEAYKRAKQLDAEMEKVKKNPITAGYEVSGKERDKYNLGAGGIYTKNGQYFQSTTRKTYSRALGDYTTVTNWTDKLTAEGAAYVQGQREQAVQSQIDVVYDYANSILEDVNKKQEEAAKAAAEVSKLLTKRKRGTGGSTKDIDNTANKIAEIQERVRQSLIKGKEDELKELQRIYLEEKKLLEDNGKDTAELTKAYGLKVEEIKEKYRKKDEENNEIARQKLLESLNQQMVDIMYAEDQLMRKTEQKYLNKEIDLDNATTSILPLLKDDDNIAPIQLEIDKTLELQAIRAAAFDAQMAQIQAILDAEKEKDILTAEQEANLLAEFNFLQNEKVQAVAESNSQIAALNKELTKQQQEDNRKLAKNITDTFTSALNSASQIISSIQDGIDTTNKEGFEKNKKMQIANATISMLVGVTSALSGLFTTKSGPWDIALAAIQAATIATTGGIQIANIKKQTFDGGGSGGASVTPSMSMSATDIPVSYTRNLMGDAETEEMNKAQQVYILESDIEESSRKVEVREQNTNF